VELDLAHLDAGFLEHLAAHSVLDVLTGLDTIRVCTGYETPRGATDDLPLDDLASAKPIYETFPGWSEPLGAARSLTDLPAAAQRYLDFVAREAGALLVLVSVGSRRDETILLGDPFAPSRAR